MLVLASSFALTYCYVLVIVLCLAFNLYEYFHLQSFGWMPNTLPVAIHAERSQMEMYPSVYVALENHHPNYPGTAFYINGWQKRSLQSLAEILPARLARTRGRIYIAAREDAPYGDVMKLLAICRASGAKSIKLVVGTPGVER
jgi:biopolymer transport protein ExbD